MQWYLHGGDQEAMDGVKFKTVEDGHQLYLEDLGHIYAYEHYELDVTQSFLKKNIAKTSNDVDL